jgi:hypothetical protein
LIADEEVFRIARRAQEHKFTPSCIGAATASTASQLLRFEDGIDGR